jgi:hypothetical protein
MVCPPRHPARGQPQGVFFTAADRETYLSLVQENAEEACVRLLA